MKISSNTPLFVAFVAGAIGEWRIDRIHGVTGESQPAADASRLQIFETRLHRAVC